MTENDLLLRDALRVLDRYAVTLPNAELPLVRQELERFLFDEDGVSRDDVVNVCQKIDDVLSEDAL